MKDRTMMHPIDDETLMAFADGALDESQFEAVADAVEADPILAERLARIVQGADLARSGYAQLLEPVPAALEASVRASVAKASRPALWRQVIESLRLSPLGAAAVAAFVAIVAMPAGYFLAHVDRSATGTDMFAQPAVVSALNSLASGENASLPEGGQIMAIATFVDANGAVCREFETTGNRAQLAIACRVDGQWEAQFAMANPGGNEAAYRPASGTALVEDFLHMIGAGDPLLDDAERAALRQGGR